MRPILRIKQFIKNLHAALTDRSVFFYTLNYHINFRNFYLIDTKHVTGCVINNSFVLPVEQCDSVLHQVFNDYDYSDLKKNDIVLDIGANVGIFSLMVSPKVKKVYAVEPLFTKELQLNIEYNSKNNITIIPYALSNEETLSIEFNGKKSTVKGKSLTELIQLSGGEINFLKCDCEGGEWSIKPEELSGIRRIEMEVHSFNNESLKSYVSMLENIGYKVKTDTANKQIILIHAFLNKI